MSTTAPKDERQHQDPLLSIESARLAVFPEADEKGPGLRTFQNWARDGYFPVHRIGRRIYIDPAECRRALDRRFKIQPVAAQ